MEDKSRRDGSQRDVAITEPEIAAPDLLKIYHESARLALVESLVSALDIREHETGLHSKRVACHTVLLARRFTRDITELQQIYWGALLHDIGKIGVPDAILMKSDSLTEEEWEQMRTHPGKGRSILESLKFMDLATEIVYCHQERYDGSGYPRGFAGKAIPWPARLFAVVDILDALVSNRPYRSAESFEKAKSRIIDLAGEQLDPWAVGAFVAEEAALKEMVASQGDSLVSDPGARRALVTDPICGMQVDPQAALRLDTGENTYYFCSGECRRCFQANIEARHGSQGSFLTKPR